MTWESREIAGQGHPLLRHVSAGIAVLAVFVFPRESRGNSRPQGPPAPWRPFLSRPEPGVGRAAGSPVLPLWAAASSFVWDLFVLECDTKNIGKAPGE